MTLTRDEFRRMLADGFGFPPFREEGNGFHLEHPGRRVVIRLEPLPDLVFGALRLARHRVRFSFEGYDDVTRHAFMSRFERFFHRGGG